MKNIILVGTLLAALTSGNAFAEETKPSTKNNKKATSTQMTPEQRQKMASMHEKMALCLRSDKPMNECRAEMKSGCKEMMGKEGCPMMG